MTDMRRTLLWVVFTMSLVLLWDAWNKHTGQPSLFGGTPRPAATGPAGPAGGAAPAAAVPAPASVGTPPVAAGGMPAVPAAPAVPASEQVVVTTDVVRATFDSVGGALVKLELLAHRDLVDPKRNVMLFDQSAKRFYAAQTGLITGQAGVVDTALHAVW